jgi:tetratricopeptide (TPR) repeat protein
VRFALAGMALAHYVAHGIWPVQLLPIYPQWKIDPASPWPYPVWLAVLVAAVWAWRCRRGWGRHALLAGGFFLLFLAPFLGFVTVSYLGFTWIMDHLLYLSLIPLAGSFAALLQLVEDRLSLAWRPMVLGITTIVTVLLAFEAHAYTMVYTDQASLWSYTLEHDPDSWLAHYNLGNEYFLSGHYAEAITHYQRALALHPGYIIAHNNLGLAYAQTGRLPEAKAEFEAALRLAPENESARHNLAQAQALLDAAGSKRP